MSSRCEFPLPGYLEIEPLIKTHWSSKLKTRDPSSGSNWKPFLSHRRTLFRHSTPLSLTIIVKRINYQTQQYKTVKTKCKKFGLCFFLSKVLNSAPEGDSHPFRRKMCRCFLDEPWSKKNPLCYFLRCVIWLVTRSRVTDGFLDNDRKKIIKKCLWRSKHLDRSISTLSSALGVCVCDMTQLLQRSMCVCNTKNFSRSRIWHVSLTCCMYTPDSRHDWERFDICRSNSCRFREIPEMLNWLKKYKLIDTGCADFSKWEVTNFLNKNLICCAVKPKEFFCLKKIKKIFPDVVQSLFFVSTGRSLVISEFKFTRRFYLHDCLVDLRDCW